MLLCRLQYTAIMPRVGKYLATDVRKQSDYGGQWYISDHIIYRLASL